MSEDTPSPVDPTEPGAPAGEPTVETTPAAAAPTAPSPAAEAAVAASPTPGEPASAPPSHMLVPKWLVFTLAGLLLVGLGFGVGWLVADRGGSDHESSARIQLPRNLPFGGPGGNSSPTTPNQSGAFLGVATAAGDNASGARVVQISSGSPADGAGLKVGDVITKVDDQSVDGPAQLAQRVRAHKSGDQVTIAYTRNANAATVKVKLGDRSAQQNRIPPQRSTPGGSGSSND